MKRRPFFDTCRVCDCYLYIRVHVRLSLSLYVLYTARYILYVWWSLYILHRQRLYPSRFPTTLCCRYRRVWKWLVHLVLSHGARDPSLELRLLLIAVPHLLLRLLWFWECSSQRLVVFHLVQWCLNVLRTSVFRKQKKRVTRNPYHKSENKQTHYNRRREILPAAN
jgi:hypothetical protein